MSWMPPGNSRREPGRRRWLLGDAGNALFSAFSSARVLAWKRGPDWVYPCSMRILSFLGPAACAGWGIDSPIVGVVVVDCLELGVAIEVGDEDGERGARCREMLNSRAGKRQPANMERYIQEVMKREEEDIEGQGYDACTAQGGDACC
jgi:hypothetical protein